MYYIWHYSRGFAPNACYNGEYYGEYIIELGIQGLFNKYANNYAQWN